jgi:predicted metalloprotease with PDZ domain
MYILIHNFALSHAGLSPMKLIPRILTFMVMITTIHAAQAPQPHTVYRLSMPKPANHLFDVEATFYNIEEGKSVLDVLLPVWRPGRYLILDLADGVQNFSASDSANRELHWQKVTKSNWRIESKGAHEVTIRYRVYAGEFEKKTRGLDIDHGFVSGESVFMYTDTHRFLPCELMVLPFGNWHVTTGLNDVPGKVNAFMAPTYDYLIDCPLEIGTQQEVEFMVEGKRHIISMSGRGNLVSDTVVRDISKIVAANYRFWGALPYEKYVFLFHCLPTAGGGVEHINSTIIGVRPKSFSDAAAYQQFLGLVSHEFFHTWNVKQFRPHGLQPYDLQHENYSHELWIAEGATSYYAPLMLVRAGIRPGKSVYDMLPSYPFEDRSRPGNAVLSVSDASFDAWIKYWHQNENSYNAESDYYSKGAHVSLLLDLEIRNRSKNAASLDDVMRLLFQQFPVDGSGYTLNDFQRLAEQCTGVSLEDFFKSYIRGTAPLPWEATLLTAGLELKPREAPMKPSWGFTTQTVVERTKIVRVLTDSPAEDAGLEPGDEIVAINGVRMRPTELEGYLGDLKEGTSTSITYFRNDLLRETTIVARLVGPPQYAITQIQSPSVLQKTIFSSWLSMPWDVYSGQK